MAKYEHWASTGSGDIWLLLMVTLRKHRFSGIFGHIGSVGYKVSCTEPNSTVIGMVYGDIVSLNVAKFHCSAMHGSGNMIDHVDKTEFKNLDFS